MDAVAVNVTGTSMPVFDSEQAARSKTDNIQPPGDHVGFGGIEVGELVAGA